MLLTITKVAIVRAGAAIPLVALLKGDAQERKTKKTIGFESSGS